MAYLIWMKTPRQYMAVVFRTRESAERYIAENGNDSWEVHEVAYMPE